MFHFFIVYAFTIRVDDFKISMFNIYYFSEFAVILPNNRILIKSPLLHSKKIVKKSTAANRHLQTGLLMLTDHKRGDVFLYKERDIYESSCDHDSKPTVPVLVKLKIDKF